MWRHSDHIRTKVGRRSRPQPGSGDAHPGGEAGGDQPAGVDVVDGDPAAHAAALLADDAGHDDVAPPDLDGARHLGRQLPEHRDLPGAVGDPGARAVEQGPDRGRRQAPAVVGVGRVRGVGGRHGARQARDRPGEQPEAVAVAAVGAAHEAPGERMLVVPGERLAGRHRLVPGDRRRRDRRGRHPAGRDQHPPGVVERGVVVGGPQAERHVERCRGVERDLDRAPPEVGGDRAGHPPAVAHAGRAAAIGGDRDRRRQPGVGHQPGPRAARPGVNAPRAVERRRAAAGRW